MKRTIIGSLKAWKSTPSHKPLVLKGARQVGKTYSLKEFGEQCYRAEGHTYHYIDLKESREFHEAFDQSLKPSDILKSLRFGLRAPIDTAHDLLILDEIQECPEAITSLKYFEQDMKELDVIAAGSHLGLQKHESSFPVGKVSFVYMFPMTFDEFVDAVDPDAADFLMHYPGDLPVPSIVHTRLLDLLRTYLFTGGLPEVVLSYLPVHNQTQPDLSYTRKVQQDLVTGYCADFAKYSGVVNAAHIQSVFTAVPYQLSLVHDESTKKFRFSDVIPNRKGFESVRGPMEWLCEARLCIRALIARKAEHPLRSYCEENRFKAFLFDTGILNCMLGIPPEVIVGDRAGAYKGFVLENFVAQELYARANDTLFSWQQSKAEVEFLLVAGGEIVPLEVKSSDRSRRSKSLDAFIARYHPSIACKLTRQNYGHNQARGITTVPLYAIGRLIENLTGGS